MITIGHVTDIDLELYDEVWYITNNTPNMKVGCKHVPELAPHFTEYVNYRHGNIKLQQLLQNYANALWSDKYDQIINKLLRESETKWILLVCYCDNVQECHRYLLYRYLRTLVDDVQLLGEESDTEYAT